MKKYINLFYLICIIALVIYTTNPLFSFLLFKHSIFYGITLIVISFFVKYIILLILYKKFHSNLLFNKILLLYNIFFYTWISYIFLRLFINDIFQYTKFCEADISIIKSNKNLAMSLMIMAIWNISFPKAILNTLSIKEKGFSILVSFITPILFHVFRIF